MSRTLSKILIICAMVVIFPLMIVGTAFACYYSIDANVQVAVFAEGADHDSDAFADVVYGGKTGTEFDINQSHLSDVELNVVSQGYNFVGWFAGDREAYETATLSGSVEYVSEDANFNFGIVDYPQLLAVFEVQTYSVSYDYKAQPEDGSTVQTTPDGGKTTYNYGELLPTLTYTGNEYTFAGWTVNEGDTVYTRANFAETGNITLHAKWNETRQITVTYHGLDGETLADPAPALVYVNDSYNLTSPLAVAGVEDGYNYSWQTAEGETITTLTNPTEDVDVYLSREAITYTVNVLGDVEFNGATASVEFTVEDLTALNAWATGKWTATYSFYEVTGLSYNSNTYTFEQLSELADAIVTANPRGTEGAVEVTAQVEEHFTQFSIEESRDAVAHIQTSEGYFESDVYINSTGSDIVTITAPYTGASTMTINELLGIDGDVYAENQITHERVSVSVQRITVEIADSTTTFDVTGNTTMLEFIDMIYSSGDFEVEVSDTLVITSLVVRFA